MNLGFPGRQEIVMLKTQYPKGTRIELDNMEATWAVPSGTKGTVEHVDDIPTVEKLDEALSELNEESDTMASIYKNRVGGKSDTIFMIQYFYNWNYRYS